MNNCDVLFGFTADEKHVCVVFVKNGEEHVASMPIDDWLSHVAKMGDAIRELKK